MALERYEFLHSKSPFSFLFISDGPKGKILKIVAFELKYIDGKEFFNLSLVDWNPKKKQGDDLIVTNNNDRDKVFATVGAAVLKFIENFPRARVYAKGSTVARTRLYQMAIVTNWKEIDSILEVYGSLNNKWQPFKKNINYEAFFVQRKKSKFM